MVNKFNNVLHYRYIGIFQFKNWILEAEYNPIYVNFDSKHSDNYMHMYSCIANKDYNFKS